MTRLLMTFTAGRHFLQPLEGVGGNVAFCEGDAPTQQNQPIPSIPLRDGRNQRNGLKTLAQWKKYGS
ncbi:MAG: hypothetical protein F6K14_32570 [Symploca sp. SIO2C1]|nr:hypothetical protein [Symploca sp. SIO2C1]